MDLEKRLKEMVKECKKRDFHKKYCSTLRVYESKYCKYTGDVMEIVDNQGIKTGYFLALRCKKITEGDKW